MNLQAAPRAIHTLPPRDVVQLDVRPILRGGGEPFSVIMEAVGRAGTDGALRLRATFEPKPLFRVLGAQGFRHWVEHGEGDDWIVWFYRERAGTESGQPGAATAAPAPSEPAELVSLRRDYPELAARLDTRDPREWTIDVRGLAPPEPMELTLATLDRLPIGTALLQLNDRVPQFLLPLLAERGFGYQVEERAGGARVRIARG
jgi:uncharacterized protein (DUF2249 family)